MSIREEFEQEYCKQVNAQAFGTPYSDPAESALWAARWMAERCADNVQGHWNDSMSTTNQKDQAYRSANVIRQLSKELSNE